MSKQSFFELIDRLSTAVSPERSRIEADIWTHFGVERAVLALDMSHFSLSVRRSGILSYLSLIRRMQLLTAPIVRECRGEVVKYEADNLMAVFAEPRDAVEAAVRINVAVPVEGTAAGAEPFTVAIGIDYGRLLMVPGPDCYGDAVNVACKLGEDMARPREVLVTAAARARLGAAFPYPLQEQQVSISGLELTTYKVDYPHAA